MTKWDDYKLSRLRAFWPTKFPLRVLATELGVTEAFLSVHAKAIGLPSRRDRIRDIVKVTNDAKFNVKCGIFAAVRQLDATTCGYFAAEAKRRGMSTEGLVVALLRTIANDKLVDATMDDADEIAAQRVAA